ncbi:permease [Salmonella bongori]|nr:permease [Salmonella bongori]
MLWRWGLAMGMLPILVPGLYQNFPAGVQMVFGNGMAAGTLDGYSGELIIQLE